MISLFVAFFIDSWARNLNDSCIFSSSLGNECQLLGILLSGKTRRRISVPLLSWAEAFKLFGTYSTQTGSTSRDWLSLNWTYDIRIWEAYSKNVETSLGLKIYTIATSSILMQSTSGVSLAEGHNSSRIFTRSHLLPVHNYSFSKGLIDMR